MTKENGENQLDNKNIRCGWCEISDEKEKVYESPGDDLENPEPFHKECSRALKYFAILVSTETNKSTDEMIKLANRLAKIDIKPRKK